MKMPKINISTVTQSVMVLAGLMCLGLCTPAAGTGADFVNGNVVQFDDNGGWTWYSDERTVVDTNNSDTKLVVGCMESGGGLGGTNRDANVNATIWDTATATSTRYTLSYGLLSYGTTGDDHSTPGLLIMPNGHYLAFYTAHNSDYLSHYRIFDPLTGIWSPEVIYDWSTQPGGDNFYTSYSNPYNMPREGRTYELSRSNGGGSPNILISTNYGTNWTYGGELTTNSIPGYVQGYFRYWGNNVDRIDFICTEAHPRDYDTSIYHGYISNAMSFNSSGTVMDTNVLDKINIPEPQNFTPVLLAGTVMPPGQTNYRCWNDKVVRYPDGSIECILTARINDNTQGNDANINPDHAFFFSRFNGTYWTNTYLCQAGYKLYSSEADYVGLGCLDPNDPNTIYLSTKFDPRAVKPGVKDTNLQYSAFHEIWKGVTTNQGTSFTWTPITQNSLRDNFRPLIPSWDGTNTALVWFRGSYASAQVWDGAVVGIVEHRAEVVGQMHYVDATTNNTFLTNGAPLVLSPAANQWHLQSGVGNGGTIISSADTIPETPANLMTQVTLPGPGTYDLWVNFWGNPAITNEDWRIEVGLVPSLMQTYRSEKCPQVQPWTQDASLVLTNTSPTTNYLYQAYAGRVVVTNNYTIPVYVGGNDLAAGDATTNTGNYCRTWYDGVSYATVEPFQIQNVFRNGPSAVTLVWNSPPPEMSLTSPTYTVQKTTSLNPPITWTTVATGIPATSEAYSTTNVDNSASDSTAFYRVIRP